MSAGDWVDREALRRSLKGKNEVYEAMATWMAKGWRVKKQGHKYGMWPPDPGVRITPPWVRVDGSPSGDATWQAKTVHRKCRELENKIERAIEDRR